MAGTFSDETSQKTHLQRNDICTTFQFVIDALRGFAHVCRLSLLFGNVTLYKKNNCNACEITGLNIPTAK